MTSSAPDGQPEDPADRIRIGDAERESALQALGTHMAAGRLDLGEYDERAASVTAATTAAQLRALFTDLPAPHPSLGPGTEIVRPAAAGLQRPAREVHRHGGRSTAQRVAAGLTGVAWMGAIALTVALGLWWTIFIAIGLSTFAGRVWGDD